jgi:hypothetical protein
MVTLAQMRLDNTATTNFLFPALRDISNQVSGISGITNIVAGISNMVADIGTSLASATNYLIPAIGSLTGTVASIDATVTNTHSIVTNIAADAESAPGRLLTRLSSVPFGSTNNVYYKSRKGYGNNVIITVSNAAQGLVLNTNMSEIIAGIYEYNMVCNWGTNLYVVKCSDPYPAWDSMSVEVTGALTLDTVPAQITGVSNQLIAVQDKITNVLAAVQGLSGLNTSNVVAGLDEIKAQLVTVKDSVDGIRFPEGETVDLSALTRIDSTTTFMGRLEQLSSQLSAVGYTAEDASKAAKTAKTQASSAAGGVQLLKTDLEDISKGLGEGNIAGKVDSALARLEEIRKSLLSASDNVSQIPKMVKLGGLYDSIAAMSKVIEDLASREGFKDFLKLETVKEGASPEDELKALNANVEEIRGSMQLMKKLMDKMAYEPQVQVDLVGE